MLLRKLVVEFIGTFFLMLTIGMTTLKPGDGMFAPLAIGSVLAVMIFAGGHISGGHYNPAVSIGVWLRGSMKLIDTLSYWAAQIAGAIVAAITVMYIKPSLPSIPLNSDLNLAAALLSEAIFTFALVYVVLNVTTTQINKGNSFYGLAIGFTVMAGAYSVGSISGAVFNPAVLVGGSLLKSLAWSHFFPYLIAEISGAVLSVLFFRYLYHPQKDIKRNLAASKQRTQ